MSLSISNPPKAINTTQSIEHSGTLTVSRHVIQWNKQASGEILFARQDGSFVPVAELKLTAEEELQVADYLMNYYRPTAIPDRNGYYAASVVVTQTGQLFVDVNNEHYIKHPFAGRGCAETGALRQIQKELQTDDVQVARVYLKSGMAKKNADGTLTEKEPGHRGSMCGECRQNYRSHSKDAQFIMVPTPSKNSGEITINSHATSAQKLGKNDAWAINHQTMYPTPEYIELAPEKNDIVKNGYLFAMDKNQPLPAIQSNLPEITDKDKENGTISLSLADYRRLRDLYDFPDLALPSLGANPTFENINRCMVQFIKRAYEAHADKVSEGKNLDITVVLIKTTKGEFFPAITVNGDLWLPSKPPELPMALANAYNQTGIEAVYSMNLNDKQIREEMNAWTGGSTKGHQLKVPDQGQLGRLLKNLKETDNPPLTIIPLNNGQLEEKELTAISPVIDVRKSFGPDFMSPKRSKIAQH